jgi:hypothetical protein
MSILTNKKIYCIWKNIVLGEGALTPFLPSLYAVLAKGHVFIVLLQKPTVQQENLNMRLKEGSIGAALSAKV